MNKGIQIYAVRRASHCILITLLFLSNVTIILENANKNKKKKIDLQSVYKTSKTLSEKKKKLSWNAEKAII